MPARSLSDEPSTVEPFDILARYGQINNILVHALLCDEASFRSDVTKQSMIKCAHMGPPLGRRTFLCDAVGSAGLGDTHRRKIKAFIDDRVAERAAEKKRLQILGSSDAIRAEYCIHPAAVEPSPAFPLWRFSCVGFVLQSYRAARVELLGPPLPLKTLDDLKRFYPSHADRLDDPSIRGRLGIGEGDRWPVALVGYVFNSLSREVDEIHKTPYVPRPGDEFFPREPPH